MHECLLQIELIDLELVSASKSNRLAKKQQKKLQQNKTKQYFQNQNRISLCREAYCMLNLFPKSQLHFPENSSCIWKQSSPCAPR